MYPARTGWISADGVDDDGQRRPGPGLDQPGGLTVGEHELQSGGHPAAQAGDHRRTGPVVAAELVADPTTTTRPPAGDLLAGITGTVYRPAAGTFGTRGSELGLFPAGPSPGDAGSMNARFRQSSAGRVEGTAGLFEAAAPHGPTASLADRPAAAWPGRWSGSSCHPGCPAARDRTAAMRSSLPSLAGRPVGRGRSVHELAGNSLTPRLVPRRSRPARAGPCRLG